MNLERAKPPRKETLSTFVYNHVPKRTQSNVHRGATDDKQFEMRTHLEL